MSLFGISFLGGVKKEIIRPLYFAPPSLLQHFTLGYDDFMADILWLRFLQSADFCSFEKGLPIYDGKKHTCEFGWSYRMVDAITELAPRFKTPYTISTLLLSVFTGDLKGSEKIMLKGLKQFPNDWRMNFYATYLYLKDIPKPELVAYYAYKAAQNGGPYWLYSLSAREHGNIGNRLLGKMILKNLLKRNLTEEQKKQVKKHLKDFLEKHKK